MLEVNVNLLKGGNKMKYKLFSLVCVLIVAATCATTYGALLGVGPTDPVTGFPQFYRDTNEVSLVLGINDPVLTPFDPVIPGNPFSAQVGFGAEAFYWAAESVIELPGGGTALLVLALEAAWANEDPVPGDQVVFGRVRIRIDITTPGTYTVIHPFGTEVFPNVPPGIRAINMTRDIGLIAGDFEAALTSDIGPFLVAVIPAPPTGFVGDPGVAQTVIGSPTGNNFFRITGPSGANLDGAGGNVVETDLFIVQGELAGPDLPPLCTGALEGDLNDDCKVDLEDLSIVMANLFACNRDPFEACFGADDPDFVVTPVVFDFGNVDPLLTSPPQTFTITNIGDDPMPIGTITIAGTNASEFIFTDVDANGATIPPGGNRTFLVAFAPLTLGPKSAVVQIPFDGTNTATVSLSGISGAPDIAVDPPAGNFGTVSSGTQQFFTISNAGMDNLILGILSLTGPDASEFLITEDNCSGLTLPPAGTCTVTVAITPKTPGAKTAALSIPSNDPDENPLDVPLTATVVFAEVIVDNADGPQGGASSTGTWLTSGGANPFGPDSVYSRTTGDTFTFSADLPLVQHAVFMRWTAWSSRRSNVPAEVLSGATLLDTLTVNQRINASEWVLLGVYLFNDTASVTITAQSRGSTNADAVRFVPLPLLTEIIVDNRWPGATPNGTWPKSKGAAPWNIDSVWNRTIGDTFNFDIGAIGTFDVQMWWTAWPSRYNNVPVEIYDGTTLLATVGVDQTVNASQWNSLGMFTFITGAEVRIISETADFSTNADAIRFVPQ